MSNAVLKLTNGETLIGDVTPSNDENYINVVNPYVIRTGVSEDSRLIMSMTVLLQYINYGKEKS